MQEQPCSGISLQAWFLREVRSSASIVCCQRTLLEAAGDFCVAAYARILATRVVGRVSTSRIPLTSYASFALWTMRILDWFLSGNTYEILLIVFQIPEESRY